MEFDQVALQNWTALCTQEQLMRERGAPADELLLMRTRIIVEMTQLLPTLSEEEKAALALVLLSNPDTSRVTTEVTDPSEVED